jgi:hypothetical protein
VRAALKALRRQRPAALILAVPVAAGDTLGRLRGDVERIVCLETPSWFRAAGAHYENFEQTTDSEVIRLLNAAADFGADATRRRLSDAQDGIKPGLQPERATVSNGRVGWDVSTDDAMPFLEHVVYVSPGPWPRLLLTQMRRLLLEVRAILAVQNPARLCDGPADSLKFRDGCRRPVWPRARRDVRAASGGDILQRTPLRSSIYKDCAIGVPHHPRSG